MLRFLLFLPYAGLFGWLGQMALRFVGDLRGAFGAALADPMSGLLLVGVASLAAGCATVPPPRPLAEGEIGRAIHGADAARHMEVFDTLDFDVISHRRWERLGESHAETITVTWPDGHETHGLEAHTRDLTQMFAHAPDAAIGRHPIRIALGDWTAVTAVMSGAFTKPMRLGDKVVPPNGRRFTLPFVTIAHWRDGRMDQEWLYWDTLTYLRQLGLAS